MNKRTNGSAGVFAIIGICILLVLAIVLGLMWGIPEYRVWCASKTGQAMLSQAEQSKKIMIETARAELEASKLRAEAIAVIGRAAKDFPEYRQQEFIGAFGEAMREGNIDQIIYVPTEANIPIVEAGRMQAQ